MSKPLTIRRGEDQRYPKIELAGDYLLDCGEGRRVKLRLIHTPQFVHVFVKGGKAHPFNAATRPMVVERVLGVGADVSGALSEFINRQLEDA